MNEPLKIMDEANTRAGLTPEQGWLVCLPESEWQSLRTALEAQAEDAEVGRQWRENSSLEKWFPFTAMQLEAQAEELAQLHRKVVDAEFGHGSAAKEAIDLKRELAQKDARIADIEKLLVRLAGGDWSMRYFKLQAQRLLNESEPQSAAHLKAEVLRGFGRHLRQCYENEKANGYPESAEGTRMAADEAFHEADLIEREAKEES